MSAWAETGRGNFCLMCFAQHLHEDWEADVARADTIGAKEVGKEFWFLDDDWGLPAPKCDVGFHHFEEWLEEADHRCIRHPSHKGAHSCACGVFSKLVAETDLPE